MSIVSMKYMYGAIPGTISVSGHTNLCWYAPDQWKLWARSASPNGISVFKTTMIVESHLRRIQHDYLHRFNRQRMDLVVSELTTLVIPEAAGKMHAIFSKKHRKASAVCRRVFKKRRDGPQHSLVVPQDLLKYYTDPIKWTCVCNGFLLSLFLLCKHVRSCYEEIQDRIKFICEIRRQRESPFWVYQHLSSRPEWRDMFSGTQFQIGNELCSEYGPDSNTEFPENGIANLEATGNLDGSDEMPQSLVNDIATQNSIDEKINHQKSIGNARFLKEYFKGQTDLTSDKILLDEIT